MTTPVTEITAGWAVPNRRSLTFDADYETMMSGLKNQTVPGINAAAAATYNNAVEASAAAATATAQAQASVAVINVTKWVAGSYGEGVCTWSPTNGRTYRAKSAFTSATDPVLDPIHWWDIASFSQAPVVALSTATPLSKGVSSLLLTDGLDYPLPSTPTEGDWVGYRNVSGGVSLRLDPGAEKVEGTAGPYRVDNPIAMGKLAYSGPSRGWVHVPG